MTARQPRLAPPRRILTLAPLRRVLTLALALLLLGTASAAAYWTAHTEAEAQATAASVGVTQTLLPTEEGAALEGTYTSSTPTLAGIMSITNTGSRDAVPALTVRQVASSAEGIPASAVTVTLAPVDAAQQCTPQDLSQGALSGELGAPLTLSEEVAPEETILVCVQTTLSPEHRSSFAGQTMDLALTSSLSYADAEQWTIEAEAPATVRQSVEDDPFAGAVQMTSHGDDGWYRELRFPQNSGNQGATSYRVFLAQENSPADRVAYREAPTGWDTAVRFRHGSPEVMDFVNSPSGGDGNTWVYVERSVDGGSSWTPEAVGKIHFVTTSNTVLIHPGWT